jgi:hypothetical protein
MPKAITLELPEDVVRQAQEIAHSTGRDVADVLTDWVRRGALTDASSISMPDAGYPIYTPYGNEDLAQELLDALHTEETPARTVDPGR